jgi:hypothetical protein
MNRINSYEELVREKERLQLQLEVHKAAVRNHVAEIKQKLNPVKNVIRFFSNFTAPAATNTLVGSGLGLSLELLVRRLFFAKTGWLIKMVGPILVKNFSANMIKKNKDTLIKKVKAFFHANGKGN